jgi:hypothetical protein
MYPIESLKTGLGLGKDKERELEQLPQWPPNVQTCLCTYLLSPSSPLTSLPYVFSVPDSANYISVIYMPAGFVINTNLTHRILFSRL